MIPCRTRNGRHMPFLVGPTTCTHLNDVLRSLADVEHLGSHCSP